MITNAVCTVIRSEDGSHNIVGTYPCMWQECEGYEVKKFGEENADKVAIWIPDLTADVKKHDFIFRGELTEIGDLDGMLTVMSASRNNYGSEELNHIEIGAR